MRDLKKRNLKIEIMDHAYYWCYAREYDIILKVVV